MILCVDCNILYNEDMTALIGGSDSSDEDTDDKDDDTDKKTVNVELDILRNGSRGGQVETIQALLNGFIDANLAIDGIFGSKTEQAVRDYQSSRDLDVDGIVGVQTWTRILK